MALDETPPFWWTKPNVQAWALAPISYLYGYISARRMATKATHSVDVPVICVGNFVTGGAGKTPTVQMLTRYAIKKKMKVGILSRGFGGAVTTATVVDLERHNAHDVGDEALLHAELALTVVSADRPKGADLLIEHGCDVIILDDGFQNPYLQKDYNLIVVDSKRGIGNCYTMPSGPLRVPLDKQLYFAHGIIIIGKDDGADYLIRRSARAAKPSFLADVKVTNAKTFKNAKVLAFAGIADPSKFFDTLDAIKIEIVDKQGFGDHHVYLADECNDLIDRAEKQQLQLVTTTKDLARLKNMGEAQNKLASLATAVEIELVPEDGKLLEHVFSKAIEKASQRRIKNTKNQAKD